MTEKSADVVPMFDSVDAMLNYAKNNPGKPVIAFISGAFPKGMQYSDAAGVTQTLPEKVLCSHCEHFEELQRGNFTSHSGVAFAQIETYLGDSSIPGAVPAGADFSGAMAKLGFNSDGIYVDSAGKPHPDITAMGTPTVLQLQADSQGKVHVIAAATPDAIGDTAAFNTWLNEAPMRAAKARADFAMAAPGGGTTVPNAKPVEAAQVNLR